MPVRDLDAIFYVKCCPEITLQEGMFHVSYDIGKHARFEVVMAPRTFLKALRDANRTSDEFHARDSVVQLRDGKH